MGVQGAIWRGVRGWFVAAKSAWLTQGLAGSAFVVFTVLRSWGVQDDAIALLGLQPGNFHTLVSHALLHDSRGHLIGNLILLELFGPFVERRLGTLAFGLGVLAITVTGAWAVILFACPENWADGSNPVGMSVSVFAVEAVGIYLACRTVMSGLGSRVGASGIYFAYLSVLRRLGLANRVVRLCQASQIATMNRGVMFRLVDGVQREWFSWVALPVTLAVMGLLLSSDLAALPGVSAIGHVAGALMGLAICVGDAVVRTFR